MRVECFDTNLQFLKSIAFGKRMSSQSSDSYVFLRTVYDDRDYSIELNRHFMYAGIHKLHLILK